jgi:TPR repeat protein
MEDRSETRREGTLTRRGKSKLAFSTLGVRLVLVMLLGLPLTLLADDDFQLGLKAYLDADYETALAFWRPIAQGGHATAQYCLGNMYYSGKGVKKDRALATTWFRKAALQGHPVAQLNLGNAYRWGEGVQQDLSEAARWWRKAADQGQPQAQFNLGTLYYFGRGVDRDQAGAAKWYRKSAANGYAPAVQFLHKLQTTGTLSPASAPAKDAAERLAALQAPHEAAPTPATSSEPVAAPAAAQRNERIRTAPARQPEPALKPASPAAATTGAAPRGMLAEPWLLARAPGHYTIQLIAVRDRGGLERYAKRHGLSGSLAAFVSHKNGQPLYTLVYGDFDSVAASKDALGRLPEAVVRAGTWIRPFSGVQLAINGARMASAD